MADILLLEASYKNKYPPIGLMKIAYFHRYICKDYVRFSKGPLPQEFSGKKWDRVYVTTLFTFEWPKTKEIIEYAYSVVKDKNEVYTGGILATLMPELIQEHFPLIHNNTGLLNKKGTLGLDREEEVDTLPLDYGILDDVDYVYPAHDAYFTYMTRGCGMRCQFCAVQTLEPTYIPYLSIRENINRINTEFGPKKDLLLMDNNVLISPCFDKIIDEIKDLGFAKGATYINPKTGKTVNRYVDFNQGLDAKLLNPYKAKRLGELAIYPARIAFDHIEDKEPYVKAITLCAENGITHMSNYLLYNGDDFSGKGSQYHADTPEDLYERMRISLDLCEELTEKTGNKITIFSFPMRYIPLSDLKRGYVGANWNIKYLRAVQRMMIPTQGKGVASKSFFEADFGTTAEEFVEFLAMPEDLLGMRGHFVEKKNESDIDRSNRKSKWEENQSLVKGWLDLYRQLGDEKESFIELIGDNVYTYEKFCKIGSWTQKCLFAHYFTVSGLLLALNEELNNGGNQLQLVLEEYPILKRRMIKHLSEVRVNANQLVPLLQKEKQEFVKAILCNMDDVFSPETIAIVSNLEKAQAKINKKIFNFSLIKYIQMFVDVRAIDFDDVNIAREAIRNLDEQLLKGLLEDNMGQFKEYLIKSTTKETAAELLLEEIENSISKLYEQLSLFDGE